MSAGPEILVVDDNCDGREIVVLFLKGVGFQAIEAATGLEALQTVQRHHPDLILLDLVLPELSGDEVTARLKADPSTRDIPIIILTALSKDSPLVGRVIAAGADEIIIKPFSFKALGEAIRHYVRQPHDPRF